MRRALVGLALLAGFLACRQMLTIGWNEADLAIGDAGSIVVQEEAGPVVIVGQDGKPVYLPVTLAGDALNPHTSLVLQPLGPPGEGGADDGGLPDGLTATLVRTDRGAEMALVADGVPASSSNLMLGVVAVNDDNGQRSAPQPLQVSVAVVANVTPDDAGTWKEFMSTSLQPASFQTHIPDIPALTDLAQQNPVHVQLYDSLWQGADEDSGTWNFDPANAFVVPLVEAGAEVQLEIFNPPNLANHLARAEDLSSYDYTDNGARQSFFAYCAKIVAYYNVDGGVLPAGQRVRWWSILGDYNQTSPSAYSIIYNGAVAAMRAVDPSIQITGPEFTDEAMMGGNTSPDGYLHPFLDGVDAGTLNAFSIHMFGTVYPTTTDEKLFEYVPIFGSDLFTIANDPTLVGPLQNPPIWVTQSNVNAQFPVDAGDGGQEPNQVRGMSFAPDMRGTKTFYASWEAYLFSQLGKSGNTGLIHWVYTAGHNADDSGANLDPQNAEVHYDPNDAGVYEKFLSYWVDYELSRKFEPTGQSILKVMPLSDVTRNETKPSVDVLATYKQQERLYTVMVTDIAPQSESDIDGPGLARTVLVDLSGISEITSAPNVTATLTTIDSLDHLDSPPAAVPVAAQPGWRYPVVLRGYGVAFLTVQVGD